MARTRTAIGVFILAFVALSAPVEASFAGVRGGSQPRASSFQWMRTEEVNRALLDVLEDEFGSEHRRAAEVRIDRLERAFAPMYATLPKNEAGLLGSATVRYALHRLFVHRHAMYMKGLAWNGETQNGSSPTAILEDRVPAYVQQVFERRLSDGFNLHELAVLAATLEHLIHGEAVSRLQAAYRLLGFSKEEVNSKRNVENVIEAYMVLLLMGGNYSGMTSRDMQLLMSQTGMRVPNWLEVRSFALEALDIAVPHSAEAPLTFSTALVAVENIGERYGHWQDSECKTMKKTLMSIGDQSTGRVKLSEFWGGKLQGSWQFAESREYLRRLGALDESRPQTPRVIISNYVLSASNCVASSDMFSVCCVNECEDLMGHVEQHIGAPSATPEQVAELVATLPSSTVAAPRTLSSSLAGRLKEAAAHHSGRVQLHGRLFAQWMHHAYPLECPYPHASGAANPLTPDEWLSMAGQPAEDSAEEMNRNVEDLRWLDVESRSELPEGSDGLDEIPWLAEEELVAQHLHRVPEHRGRSFLRGLVFVASLCSMALTIARLGGSASRSAITVGQKVNV